jgi:putative Mn2+ efflux pump MntP
MALLEILIIAIALSMDALAVTISNLIAHPHLSRVRRLALPVTFGVFQGLMVLIGYFAGSFAVSYIEAYAGLVALVILAAIGGKMVFEAVRGLYRGIKQKAKEANRKAADGKVGEGSREAVEGTASANNGAAEAASSAATLSLPAILLQGVATSIDALIVGVSFVALGANIALTSSIIGIATFLICLVGLFIGKRVGLLLGDRALLAGGIILILIGIKTCFF